MHKGCGGRDHEAAAPRVIKTLLQGRYPAYFDLGIVLFEQHKVTPQKKVNMIIAGINPQLGPQIIGFLFAGYQAQAFARLGFNQLPQKVGQTAAAEAA